MAKRLLSLVLSLILGGSLLFHGSAPISALEILEIDPNPVVRTLPPEQLSQKEAITQFLKSIPRNYYTVQGTNQIKSLVKDQDSLLIDVRSSKEYQRGHIPGAINIPLPNLGENLDQIPKNRPVILYCSTGYRTGIGLATLRLLGYENIQGFPGSMTAWQNAGEAIER
jgi:rhodanese-related sulfurtransferase